VPVVENPSWCPPKPSWKGGMRSGTGCAIGGAASNGSLDTVIACKQCGYTVVRFAGCRWSDETDYYWMRNYAPDARMPSKMQQDVEKLTSMLREDPASAAYACGCSWQSVVEFKPLDGVVGTPAAPHGGAGLEGKPLQPSQPHGGDASRHDYYSAWPGVVLHTE